ncbi:MAG: hypothetical protein KAU52_09480, partial [Methanosarcinales archaeon]|nr:hypothetical protein [Methanosarcinales archaeon]
RLLHDHTPSGVPFALLIISCYSRLTYEGYVRNVHKMFFWHLWNAGGIDARLSGISFSAFLLAK